MLTQVKKITAKLGKKDKLLLWKKLKTITFFKQLKKEGK